MSIEYPYKTASWVPAKWVKSTELRETRESANGTTGGQKLPILTSYTSLLTHRCLVTALSAQGKGGLYRVLPGVVILGPQVG